MCEDCSGGMVLKLQVGWLKLGRFLACAQLASELPQ